MSDAPVGRPTTCPACNADVMAIIPEKNGVLVDDEENADGKVWVNCHNCGERFLRHYRIES